ncbi:MAG TPA: alpha/beta fold hydrolase [Candidatus Saccharimonadales bacterium]|nr:alpha/beta fold hydrolase [Candidatus Saccharimonadales bacterium]
MANEIKTFFLNGPAGKLEALLNEGQASATHVALVCHPHPLFGGTVHNKVVYHAMKALSGFGFPVLRFNFRGAGLSEGQHDNGRGEVDDVRAALDWLHSEYRRPIVFCGFSFGAATGLRAACPDDRVVALISLGTPVAAEGRFYSFKFLANCAKPKLFISGALDQYGPEAQLRQVVESAAAPRHLVLVPDADHFFERHLAELQTAIRDWIPSTLGLPAGAEAG